MGLFEKIKQGLTKTRSNISGSLNSMFANFRKVDEEFLESLEEVLIMSDVGFEVTEEIIDELRRLAKLNKIKNAEELKEALIDIISSKMDDENISLELDTVPSVILVIGVNGTGKTTTAAKLANLLKIQGKKVILAAADTFRAAAAEQLEVWADRIGVDMVRHNEGSDPAAVVYDAIKAAVSRGCDVVICDTAGRLHNKKHLMDELSKIRRVIDRELPQACKETLLVLDATTGQNALNQAKEFKEAAGITGIVISKLDGTAKGGMAIAVKKELGIPVKFIGLGEQLDDLQAFVPQEFAKALLD